MNFGEALHNIKNGTKVAREGWNGKGMYIFLFSKSEFCIQNDDMSMDYPIDDETDTPIQHIGFDGINGFNPIGDFILLKTAKGNCIPWVTSQEDVLAEDWTIADFN